MFKFFFAFLRKSRWFAVHERRLFYFLDERAPIPKGSVSLEAPRGADMPVQIELDMAQERSNCFVLHAVGFRWILNASSAQVVTLFHRGIPFGHLHVRIVNNYVNIKIKTSHVHAHTSMRVPPRVKNSASVESQR